jgi:uncharacterized membrane protein YvlD (DUF360 family)
LINAIVRPVPVLTLPLTLVTLGPFLHPERALPLVHLAIVPGFEAGPGRLWGR